MTLTVAAPSQLCMQVIASAGEELERRSEFERVVRFETKVFGRRYFTTELVSVRGNAIDYRWLSGPLPHVVETIECLPSGDRRTEVRHRGEFGIGPRLIDRLSGLLVRPLLRRVVWAHLAEAKRLAEIRFERSHVFRGDA